MVLRKFFITHLRAARAILPAVAYLVCKGFYYAPYIKRCAAYSTVSGRTFYGPVLRVYMYTYTHRGEYISHASDALAMRECAGGWIGGGV